MRLRVVFPSTKHEAILNEIPCQLDPKSDEKDFKLFINCIPYFSNDLL
jgi:hypothetical protein